MTFAGGDLREKVRLDSIITLIDADNFDFDLNNSSVAYSQILYGDILLLNKCDLVTDTHLKKIEFNYKLSPKLRLRLLLNCTKRKTYISQLRKRVWV
jgi:G3E family GTPase